VKPRPIHAAISRGRRRWFHYRDWRLWLLTLLTLSTLSCAVLAGLFFWPGLSCSWDGSDGFSFHRGHTQFQVIEGPMDVEIAVFQCGPVHVEKCVYRGVAPEGKSEFATFRDAYNWGCYYSWSSGHMSACYRRD
jgi:hypothetical protein